VARVIAGATGSACVMLEIDRQSFWENGVKNGWPWFIAFWELGVWLAGVSWLFSPFDQLLPMGSCGP